MADDKKITLESYKIEQGKGSDRPNVLGALEAPIDLNNYGTSPEEDVFAALSAHGDPVKIAEGMGELIEAAKEAAETTPLHALDRKLADEADGDFHFTRRLRNALAAIGK